MEQILSVIGSVFMAIVILCIVLFCGGSAIRYLLEERKRLKLEKEKEAEAWVWKEKDEQRRKYNNWAAKNFIRQTGEVDQQKLHEHMNDKLKPPNRYDIDFEIG